MGSVGFESINGWGSGVITLVDAEVAPTAAMTLGYNTALYKEGAGQAIVGKRRGWRPARQTNTAGPVVTDIADNLKGMFNYIVETGGNVTTSYLFLAASAGALYLWNPDAPTTSLTTSTSTQTNAFKANSCVRVGDTVYDIGCGKKWSGITLVPEDWGHTAPSTSPTLVASGSGLHNGTYNGKYTIVKAGIESDGSPVSGSVIATSDEITWTVPAAATGETRKLYLKEVNTMTDWYLVDTITTSANTTHVTSVADSDLIIPLESGHNQPPTGVANALYKDRLFVLDKTGRVFWSKLGRYEYFNQLADFFDCERQSGDFGSALVNAFEKLYIFKNHSIWQIEGTDPKTWVITKIFSNLGHWSAVYDSTLQVLVVEGIIYFWDPTLGPMAWAGPGTAPEPLGLTIQSTIDDIRPIMSVGVVASSGHDPVDNRIIWCYDSFRAIVYNYRTKVWESIKWDPFRMFQFCTYIDTSGKGVLYSSGPYGKFFTYGAVDSDAIDGYTVPTKTTNVTITTTATFLTSLTISGANFPTNANGLANVNVTFLDSNGLPHTRGQISTNTSTVLTFSTSSPLLTQPYFTVAGTYTLTLGGPYFEFDTNWNSGGRPFQKKRYEFLFIDGLAPTVTNNVTIAIGFDRNPSFGQSQSVATGGKSCTWNATIWGDPATTNGVYSTSETFTKRLRIGRTGRLWKAKFANYCPDQPVKIKSLAVQSELLTGKLG